MRGKQSDYATALRSHRTWEAVSCPESAAQLHPERRKVAEALLRQVQYIRPTVGHWSSRSIRGHRETGWTRSLLGHVENPRCDVVDCEVFLCDSHLNGMFMGLPRLRLSSRYPQILPIIVLARMTGALASNRSNRCELCTVALGQRPTSASLCSDISSTLKSLRCVISLVPSSRTIQPL